MVILGFVLCLSLGACLGFLGAGLCAIASDKPQRRLNAKVTPMWQGLGEQQSNVSNWFVL